MEKTPKTKGELEQLLLVEIRTFPNCEHVLDIVVIPILEHADIATWTVSCFNPGNSWRMGSYYRGGRVTPAEGRGPDSFQRECEQRARRLTTSLSTPIKSVQAMYQQLATFISRMKAQAASVPANVTL